MTSSPKRGKTKAEAKTARAVYQKAAQTLIDAKVPFLVGGAFALGHHTSVLRDTKDFDVFVRPADVPHALGALEKEGYRTELLFPHWLGKAYDGDHFIDVIFSSGNGVTVVDDDWFRHAQPGRVFDLPVLMCPPEEIIWSKAFILERERFDGADVNHLLRECPLDWKRLLDRFGAHWRVLLAHVVLFGYVYPGERDRIPGWVLDELHGRALDERHRPPDRERVCQGTLLSREQYLLDVEDLGYADARITRPEVHMTERDVTTWTNAIPGRSLRGKGNHQRRGRG